MKSDYWLILICALALLFVGGVMEYAFKIGIPHVNYGQNDTTLTVSKPDTTHDTITKTIISVKVKHDTLIQTVVSYPMDSGFDHVVDSHEVVTYSTGKRYLDGDSIGVGVSSSILPKSIPNDWAWYLDRYKSSDSCYNILRIDSVIVNRNPLLGRWYVQLPLTILATYGGYQAGKHWKP